MKVDRRWACGVCLCRYYESETVINNKHYPTCPNCGQLEDVFRFDDSGWSDSQLDEMWNFRKGGKKRSPVLKKTNGSSSWEPDDGY